ncbi:MAG: sigma-70 family RNA polymerase sigma factor [Planctomycetota bacterium]
MQAARLPTMGPSPQESGSPLQESAVRSAPSRALEPLLAGIARGEEASLRALYDQTRRRIRSVVRTLVRCDHGVDEVLLEVYEQIWKQAGRFDGHLGSAWTWLVVIARSRALDHRRAERARSARRGALDFSQEVSSEQDPAKGCAEADEGLLVRHSLEALPSEQRRTLEVVFFDGLTHREAAERLHVPLGTVKSRVRRGLEALELNLRRRAAQPIELEDRAS